jgi:hypothetical protein
MAKKISIMVICILAFALLSCRENPVTSVTDKSAQSQSTEKSITFIPLPKAPAGLKKGRILTDTKLITVRSGGLLQIDANYPIEGTNDKVTVHVKLQIPPYALPYSQYLTMTLDEETLSGSVGVNVVFGPHGTTFLKPALLDIDADGLELSSLPPDTKVQLYYFNPDSGNFELMTVKKATYNFNAGKIQCLDGQLPHFSRYAFGYVR